MNSYASHSLINFERNVIKWQKKCTNITAIEFYTGQNVEKVVVCKFFVRMVDPSSIETSFLRIISVKSSGNSEIGE